jgi:molybdopterin-containing oxidoreductase family iron-sulfur binding subunit
MKKMTRKEFLKLSGAGLVVLLGGQELAVLESAGQTPAQGKTTKQPRKQWAMIVDTRKCAKDQGCTRCMEACDSAHNIPDISNKAHEIKWIWNEPVDRVFNADDTRYMEASRREEWIPVLCNHCDSPPCVRVCPTGATWKREEDGIVMMDWHRCIGCRYCMAACPYGSRSFNWVDPRPYIETLNPNFPTRTIGVVEKCTFCPERLVVGKLPACVEACPEKALIFGDVNDPKSEIREVLAESYILRRKPELGTGPNIYYLI